jgi:predicted nucleic acid-binding protein
MIVVSDTSAITSLLHIRRVELLLQIYEQVFIPNAVRDELRRSHPVLPEFLQCRAVADIAHVQRLHSELDLGEAEAIVLAKELKADDLLIDEAHGRRIAVREGVHVIGLLGVLLEAKGRGFISSVRQLAEDLQNKAGFHISNGVKELIFEAAGE